MRLAYAKWLVEFVEQHGIGLERGEYAQWEEALFRLAGPGPLGRSEVLPVEGDLALGNQVLTWEPEVLAGMAHELIAAVSGETSEEDQHDS